MARRLFPAVLLQLPNGDPAASGTFRLFTDPFAGTQITDVKLSDSTSDLPVSGDMFVANVDGNVPWLRGPDTGVGAAETVAMFIDTGIGVRYPLFAVDAQAEAIGALAEVRAFIAAGGTTNNGGGLPVGTTLDQIGNGQDRLAMTLAERNKLSGVAANATNLQLGTTAATAKRGDYKPTPAEIGAVQSMSGGLRLWARTASQGMPTAGEGRVDGDWLLYDPTV